MVSNIVLGDCGSDRRLTYSACGSFVFEARKGYFAIVSWHKRRDFGGRDLLP